MTVGSANPRSGLALRRLSLGGHARLLARWRIAERAIEPGLKLLYLCDQRAQVFFGREREGRADAGRDLCECVLDLAGKLRPDLLQPRLAALQRPQHLLLEFLHTLLQALEALPHAVQTHLHSFT